VRPYGDDLYNTGRETFLLPVEWKDGWPIILENGKTIPYVHAKPDLPATTPKPPPMSGAFKARDEFDGKALPLNWVTMRIPQQRWWRLDGGKLVLTARPETIGGMTQPSFWGRRQQHINASASTEMRFAPTKVGDKAGMVAVQSDDYFFFLGLEPNAQGQDEIVLERRAGPERPGKRREGRQRARDAEGRRACLAEGHRPRRRLRLLLRPDRRTVENPEGRRGWHDPLDQEGRRLRGRAAGRLRPRRRRPGPMSRHRLLTNGRRRRGDRQRRAQRRRGEIT
jgi:hypothetical protein